jgi:hypothetical protein
LRAVRGREGAAKGSKRLKSGRGKKLKQAVQCSYS